MNTKKVRTICALNWFGNYSDTARATGQSLSSVRKQVREIEDELGFNLFEYGVSLDALIPTKDGKQILPMFFEINNVYHNMMSFIENSSLNEIKFNIGIVQRAPDMVVENLISNFMIAHEDIIITVERNTIDTLIEMLRSRSIDCLFALREEMDNSLLLPEIRRINIYRHTGITLAISQNSIFSQYKSISLSQLREERLLLNQHLYMREGNYLGARLFRQLGYSLSEFHCKFIDFINYDYIMELVRKDFGVLFLTNRPYHNYPGVVFLPLAECDLPITMDLYVNISHKNITGEFLKAAVSAGEYSAKEAQICSNANLNSSAKKI